MNEYLLTHFTLKQERVMRMMTMTLPLRAMLADQEAEGESGSLGTWKIATKKIKYT